MKKFLLMMTLLLSTVVASVTLALTLDEAKSQGLVGERTDGFIAAVEPNPNAEVQALVNSTNEGRRQAYANLAKSNNITVEAVALLAAEKIYASASSGQYLQNKSGQWERKP